MLQDQKMHEIHFYLNCQDQREIGDDFYFVLVGQPINDGYPSWMKDNKGITYYSMPALDTDDVVILLEQSGVAENTVDMENLAKTVISVIGNNVLNIIFAILELKKWYCHFPSRQ